MKLTGLKIKMIELRSIILPESEVKEEGKKGRQGDERREGDGKGREKAKEKQEGNR